MFTGMVQEIGTLRHIGDGPTGARFEVACASMLERLASGDSVSVAGVGLIVVGRDDRSFSADVDPETLARTTLGRASRGTRVNLERAATPFSTLGGHLVQGHVDATARLTERASEGGGARLALAIPKGLARYIVDGGRVALDGVSLIVVAVDRRTFEVTLVPHVVEQSTLGALRAGDEVNCEVDIIARYVERMLGRRAGRK